ncbi:MAG: hypothetical protein FWG70_09400 [Oscillospiraceae bacterium]|nr:hypothetical protein [Oscillospiraceae bacterium]
MISKNKKLFIGIIIGIAVIFLLIPAIMILFFTVKTPDLNETTNGSSAQAIDTVTVDNDEKQYADIPVYNVPVKNIGDSDILVNEITFPTQFEISQEVSILRIIDDSRIIISINRLSDEELSAWSPVRDIVIYDFTTNTMSEPLNSISKNELFYDTVMYLVYADEKYCLVTTTAEPMTYAFGKLILFDMINNTHKIVFEYPVGEGGVYTGYHPNSILIWDEHIYFDDYIVGNTDSSLYVYDIKQDELRIVEENAMNPIAYKNEIWFFTPDESGTYTLLKSKSGGDVLKNHHQIGELVSSYDKLFTTRGMGEDENSGSSLTGIFEWNSDTAIAESRLGNILVGLRGNNDFIAWHTSMPHQPPCIYDIEYDTIYEFRDEYAFERCEYMFDLNGAAGLLYMAELDESYARTGNTKYFLFQKP